MIELTREDGVAVLTLDRDVTNALSLELLRTLNEVLKKMKSDPAVQGLVLVSSNTKFFSIGFDLPQLIDLSVEDFRTFFRSFNRTCLELYTLPKPTVAAVNGHAIAGGCILALCCDYRFIADGRKFMGLNEIHLGLPLPYLPDCILKSLVGDRWAREVMESGEFHQPEKLLQIGLVDQALPQEEVLPRSIHKARKLGAMSSKAYEVIKRNRTEGVEHAFLARWQEKEEIFLDCWTSQETRELLKEALEKF